MENIWKACYLGLVGYIAVGTSDCDLTFIYGGTYIDVGKNVVQHRLPFVILGEYEKVDFENSENWCIHISFVVLENPKIRKPTWIITLKKIKQAKALVRDKNSFQISFKSHFLKIGDITLKTLYCFHNIHKQYEIAQNCIIEPDPECQTTFIFLSKKNFAKF